MCSEVSRLDLTTLAPELHTPAFFFLGRLDRWVPPAISQRYIDALRAPSKELLWFEDSAHEPFLDEPAKFQRAMLELVLPRARGPGRGVA